MEWMVPPEKLENDLNNDISELNIDDLEQVIGGASTVALKDPEPLPMPILLASEPVRPGDFL